LLATLFDRLLVGDGRILEYVPRADRATEVTAMRTRDPEGTVTAVETEYGWRANGRSRKVLPMARREVAGRKCSTDGGH
jgi:hypothetical protein